MKLRHHQAAAAASKASIVVLRWGPQSGKDAFIEAVRGEHDFVIMPGHMAAENADQYENRWVFQDRLITDGLLNHIEKEQKKHHRTKKIFLNECAFFDIELIPLIVKLQKKWPKAQIYLISTPRGGWKLGERGVAGLEFDMMCANLEMHSVYEWYYSRMAAPWPEIK